MITAAYTEKQRDRWLHPLVNPAEFHLLKEYLKSNNE
jgi:hypothetical protein